jgi:hypothetical protein
MLRIQHGVASRMGSLRTIAAVHHQINHAVAMPHNPHMECKNVVARDSCEINLLPVVGVRGAPNLDATPNRPSVREGGRMLPVARLRASFSRIFAFAASMRACCSGVYFGMNHRLPLARSMSLRTSSAERVNLSPAMTKFRL